MDNAILARSEHFCGRFGLRVPILLAPMAGACTPPLSIAVANAGGAGACGALPMSPEQILSWVAEFRAGSAGVFQLNTWIRDPTPHRDASHEAEIRTFLERFGPRGTDDAPDAVPPDFDLQCEAMLLAHPPIISSVMGLYPAGFVDRLKGQGIAWFASVTTVAEALAAEAAGADVIVAQGSEAGGHRGCFNAAQAEWSMAGLFALLPAVVDAVSVPVVAAGGIADPRGVAAAFLLGASAVQAGTAFLRCVESSIAIAWKDALRHARPEDTMVTRAFSGRAGRSLANEYVRAAAAPDAPTPAPYPVQRGLTSAMRAEARNVDDIRRMQAWAGQAAALARDEPAADTVRRLWDEARAMLAWTRS